MTSSLLTDRGSCCVVCWPSCHISIHVLFLTNFSFWASNGQVFVSLMISHHLEVKLNKNSRQDETSLSDNAKKQSNTMLSLMATKKLLIGWQEVPWFSQQKNSNIAWIGIYFHTFLSLCLIESNVIMISFLRIRERLLQITYC